MPKHFLYKNLDYFNPLCCIFCTVSIQNSRHFVQY